MKHWEYMTDTVDNAQQLRDALNHLDEKGWEFVAVTQAGPQSIVYVVRRPAKD